MALLCILVTRLGFADTDQADAGLYYAAEEALTTNHKWELRVNAGYDFSNSFLAIYPIELGALYMIDPSMSVGLEGAIFASGKKGSAETLATELKKFDYDMYAISPLAKAVGLFRLTPISGLVNVFSRHIVKIDISLVAKAGVIRYQTAGWGPTAGVGLETLIGMGPNWGLTIAFNYEYDKPTSDDWLWRAGILVGPSYRF